jgi:hypothetical protein
MALETPILFIIFNRPDTTRLVFNEIRRVRPTHLYIAADGPRHDHLEENTLCEETRRVVEKIDWPCEIKTLFREKNLGCKEGVSSAINWFFENVEEGIILEDDCLPDPTFFNFCQELLKKYRDKKEIMHISGLNLQFGEKFGQSSYYFSHLPHIWGWATWRRAWKKYDIEMRDLKNFVTSNKASALFDNKKIVNFFNSLFLHINNKKIDTWDAQWTYSIMKTSGLAITPNINLIKNIGFGIRSTHTKEGGSKLQQEANSLNKINHPTELVVNQEADSELFKKVYLVSTFDKIKLKIRIILGI